jgi:hypothetical protein
LAIASETETKPNNMKLTPAARARLYATIRIAQSADKAAALTEKMAAEHEQMEKRGALPAGYATSAALRAHAAVQRKTADSFVKSAAHIANTESK